MRFFKYFRHEFLVIFRTNILFVLMVAIPLAIILLPLWWWWGYSLLFIPYLFRSLTGRSIVLIIFLIIIAGFAFIPERPPNFFSTKPSWKRSRYSYLFKDNNHTERFAYLTLSTGFLLIFIFMFVVQTFGNNLPWQEGYIVAVIQMFPFYFGLFAGSLLDVFVWFWLYWLRILIFWSRGELDT